MAKNIVIIILSAAVIIALVAGIIAGVTLVGLKDRLAFSGSVIVFEADKTNPADEEMDTVVNLLKTRLDGLGYSNASVHRKDSNKFEVKIPNIIDHQSTAETLGATARLQFFDSEGNVVLTGSDIKNAKAEYGQTTELGESEHYVELTLTSEGKEKFAEATAKASALASQGMNYIAITIDDNVISAPMVNEPINSKTCIISGDFDAESATALASNIRSGQLPFSLTIFESYTVDPK